MHPHCTSGKRSRQVKSEAGKHKVAALRSCLRTREEKGDTAPEGSNGAQHPTPLGESYAVRLERLGSHSPTLCRKRRKNVHCALETASTTPPNDSERKLHLHSVIASRRRVKM